MRYWMIGLLRTVACFAGIKDLTHGIDLCSEFQCCLAHLPILSYLSCRSKWRAPSRPPIAMHHFTLHAGGPAYPTFLLGAMTSYIHHICSHASTRRMLLKHKALPQRIILQNEYSKRGHQGLRGDSSWPSLIPKAWPLCYQQSGE